MNPRAIPVGAFEVNALLLPVGPGERIVVDPGAADPIVRALRDAGASLRAIVLTHGHVDHLAGLTDLLREFSVPVYLHPADAAWAFSSVNALPPWYPRSPDRPADLRPLREGEFRFGDTAWTVLETPGHTPGGVCLHHAAAQCLVSGDTLFRDGVGRTDLPGGDADALARSLRRLLELPDETTVWPGHGAATSIGRERRMNPYLASAGQNE